MECFTAVIKDELLVCNDKDNFTEIVLNLKSWYKSVHSVFFHFTKFKERQN